MAEFNIPIPAPLPPDIVAHMRAAQPVAEFDEHGALQRMQRVAFLRSMHAQGKAAQLTPDQLAEWAQHQQRVATYSQVKATKPPAVPAPLPTAAVPRTPRPTVPAPVQPSPALAGVSRRTELLGSLLSARPVPVTPTDSLV